MTTTTMPDRKHTKGNVAPGKVNRNWRVLAGVDQQLHFEATRLGYSSVAAYINAHFTKWFNTEPGDTIQREP